MSEAVGPVSVLPAEGDARMAGVSDELLNTVDEEVRRQIDGCYQKPDGCYATVAPVWTLLRTNSSSTNPRRGRRLRRSRPASQGEGLTQRAQ